MSIRATKTKEKDLLDGKTVGELIAEGLEEFANVVEADPSSAVQKFTCHKISLDLNPTPYEPRKVKETRQLLGASQAIFAQFLGVSVSAVRGWEQGVNPPRDAAARIMDEIRHNPKYWRRRISELAIAKTSRKVSSR